MDSPQVNTIHNLRPTVVCCCVADKKLLMFLKKDYKMWLLPQGGVKEDETYEQTLVRELGEEVGTDFLNNIVGEPKYFFEGSLEFSPKRDDKEKFTEESPSNVDIKGKYYYFYVIPCKSSTIEFTPAKFDEAFWADYAAAQGLMNLMYQVKKKELLLQALEKLKDGGFIA
jgi:8-oxo-dGTP pyrophosphatase MutT (NUDIX family)